MIWKIWKILFVRFVRIGVYSCDIWSFSKILIKFVIFVTFVPGTPLYTSFFSNLLDKKTLYSSFIIVNDLADKATCFHFDYNYYILIIIKKILLVYIFQLTLFFTADVIFALILICYALSQVIFYSFQLGLN